MKTVIVGGGACGAGCAARLRRLDEKAEIIILEATDEISIANCGLPYYCSGVISSRDDMIVAKPHIFSGLLNIDVRLNSKVTSINPAQKTVTVNNNYELTYDNLVLALGASPVKPPIAGIHNKKIFTVRTLSDADRIKHYIKSTSAKNAVVIGGGFIGVEMAENFLEMGLNTTLAEAAPQILTPFDSDMVCFAQNELKDKGCKLILNNGVKAFKEDTIELSSGDAIPYDIAILGIGVKPETKIAEDAGITLGIHGSIKVNEYMQTSIQNIWAGGDSVEVIDFVSGTPSLIPLAGPANRQGRIIADNICGKNQTYKGSQGTCVIKVFDRTLASVGLNEKQLEARGIKYLKNIVMCSSHAGYYPNAKFMTIKLLFTPEGKILGAQSTGYEGVEKRIDVISTVMRLNGKVEDLTDLELCYAPPYSSAKDPVNLLGMSSQNILDGLFKPAFYEDLKDAVIIDVRPCADYEISNVEGALSIPGGEIRKRLDEIPKDKKVVLHCRRGYTSYVASRILSGFGYINVYSLCGGKLLYDEITKDREPQFAGV